MRVMSVSYLRRPSDAKQTTANAAAAASTTNFQRVSPNRASALRIGGALGGLRDRLGGGSSVRQAGRKNSASSAQWAIPTAVIRPNSRTWTSDPVSRLLNPMMVVRAASTMVAVTRAIAHLTLAFSSPWRLALVW